MKRYSESERQEVEDTIIALIRDYNHQGMIEHVIRHGIDSSKYFHDQDNRRVFEIYLRMHKQGIPIFIEAFEKYINDQFESDIKMKRKIYEKFLLTMSNTRSYLSPMNADFFLWKFKEMIIQDYWNHIFKMNESNSWKTLDLIENSWYIVDGFQELWNKLAKKFEHNPEDSIEESIKQKVKDRREGKSTACKTNLNELDNFMGGFKSGELYLIAGRPSMGKTTFALGIIKGMMYLGKKVHLFTLEMPRESLINSFIADDMNLTYKQIDEGDLTDQQLEAYLQWLNFYENHELLVIDELENNTLSEFVQRCEEIDADARVVDYLQLLRNEEGVKTKLGNREQEVSHISQTLKRTSKKLKNPIIALCQLSRSVEMRPNKRPMLSDLRESGSLEQDADVIIFLYRYAYYMKQQGKFVNSWEEGNLDVIIAKGRKIGTDEFKMWLDLKNTRVYEGYRYSM